MRVFASVIFHEFGRCCFLLNSDIFLHCVSISFAIYYISFLWSDSFFLSFPLGQSVYEQNRVLRETQRDCMNVVWQSLPLTTLKASNPSTFNKQDKAL